MLALTGLGRTLKDSLHSHSGSVGYRRFQLLYLPRNTGSSIYSADQSRPYK